jgi:hypothetical protein
MALFIANTAVPFVAECIKLILISGASLANWRPTPRWYDTGLAQCQPLCAVSVIYLVWQRPFETLRSNPATYRVRALLKRKLNGCGTLSTVSFQPGF